MVDWDPMFFPNPAIPDGHFMAPTMVIKEPIHFSSEKNMEVQVSGPAAENSTKIVKEDFLKHLSIPAIFDLRYDFITCTEVIEHVHEPFRVFEKLFNLLVPGGVLALMTGICDADIEREFSGWHYHRDCTHICFYRPQTLDWIAQKFQVICTL